MEKLHFNGHFEGFVVDSILQFAGGTILFCKFDSNMLSHLKQTIELFEWCPARKLIGKISLVC